jgi:hypothetical protein
VVEALREIVRIAEQHGVAQEELDDLRQRVKAVEIAPDDATKLSEPEREYRALCAILGAC